MRQCKFDSEIVCDKDSCWIFDRSTGIVRACEHRLGVHRSSVAEVSVYERKPSAFDKKYLKVLGFGKDESEWISQYDSWPVREGASCGYFMVGRGDVTSSFCGRHLKYYFCDNVELHLAEFLGKDIWRNVVCSCYSYKCRRCWKYGWCVRRANMIDSRFLTAEVQLGLPYLSVEHLFASVPKLEYGLPYDVLSAHGIGALKASGAYTGCVIFHGFRKDYDTRELVYSPHFHSLAYLRDSYDRCRNCSKFGLGLFWECDGFEGRTRRAHVNDGWVVGLAKNERGVVEKRASVYSTSWYQLEHSAYRVDVAKFNIVKWFGHICKVKTVVKPLEHKCVVCKSSMRVGYPEGAEFIVSNRGEHGFLKDFMTEHVDDSDSNVGEGVDM